VVEKKSTITPELVLGAYVIAQQYSSATFFSLFFHSRTEKNSALFKKLLFQTCNFFKKLHKCKSVLSRGFFVPGFVISASFVMSVIKTVSECVAWLTLEHLNNCSVRSHKLCRSFWWIPPSSGMSHDVVC